VRTGGRSLPGDSNDNDHGKCEEHMQGGEKLTANGTGVKQGNGKPKVTEDRKGKGNEMDERKGYENGKGKRKGKGNRNRKGKGTDKQTPGAGNSQSGGKAKGE
jgi:hypothetical protein